MTFKSNIQHLDAIKNHISELNHFLECIQDHGHVYVTREDIAQITALIDKSSRRDS